MPNLKEKLASLTSLLTLSFLITSAAMSDDIVKYGGSIEKKDQPLAVTKSIFFANQEKVIGPLIRQYELGTWFDNSNVQGHRNSVMGSASLGINVNAGYVFGQALVGPALISAPDTILGGPFQFNNDIAFGIRDPDTKATIGFDYKHLSSAGIELPNKGRDFIMFRVSIPW